MIERVELPDQYKIGNEKVDTQHAQLFAVLMNFIKLFQNKENKNEKKIEEETNELLTALRSYSQSHFLFEERLMEKMKYTELEQHKELHKTFIGKIIEIQKDALKYNKDKKSFMQKMALFLKDWYMSHILEEDKKYIIFEKEAEEKAKTTVKMKAQSPT